MPMQIPVPSPLPYLSFLVGPSHAVLLPTHRAQSRHPHYHDHNPCRHFFVRRRTVRTTQLSNTGAKQAPTHSPS